MTNHVGNPIANCIGDEQQWLRSCYRKHNNGSRAMYDERGCEGGTGDVPRGGERRARASRTMSTTPRRRRDC
ncbi:hypothetical protein Tco_0237269 [Tanacetum coccineum]